MRQAKSQARKKKSQPFAAAAGLLAQQPKGRCRWKDVGLKKLLAGAAGLMAACLLARQAFRLPLLEGCWPQGAFGGSGWFAGSLFAGAASLSAASACAPMLEGRWLYQLRQERIAASARPAGAGPLEGMWRRQLRQEPV